MVDDQKEMIYLSGKSVEHPDIGLMMSFNVGKQAIGNNKVWAADNGCFARPDLYSDDKYLDWLDKFPRETCLFATAPDVVGNAKETLERSLPLLPKIRSIGYKSAFIAQDGATKNLPWEEFDCLFIGGTTTWKLSQSAADIMAEAKRNRKWLHVGRVNSYRRLSLISILGADSCDGTFLAFGPDKNLPRLLRWFEKLEEQTCLNLKGV